jgi:hypothetical protein
LLILNEIYKNIKDYVYELIMTVIIIDNLKKLIILFNEIISELESDIKLLEKLISPYTII